MRRRNLVLMLVVGVALSNAGLAIGGSGKDLSKFSRLWADKVGKELVFWSARPECYVWMRVSKTFEEMLKDKLQNPVNIIAARNEYETRQFVITPAPDIKKEIDYIEFSVDDLVGPEENKISKNNVLIEWLRYSFQRCIRKKVLREIFVPDPLIPTNIGKQDWEDYKGRVDEPTNTTFWVTFYIPKDIPAGIYKGTVYARVNLKNGKVIRLSREIRINVLDITLPHMTHFRTGLFSSKLEYIDWFIPDLAKFRISFGALPSEPEKLLKYGRLMHKLGVQLTFVGPWLDLYDALGLTPSYRKGKPPKQALEDCRKLYERVYPILEREGWLGEVYSRMPDEFGSERIAQKCIEYIRKLRKWAPGIRTLVTRSGDNPKLAEKLDPYIDIWCASVVRPHYQKLIKEGDEVWGYIHSYTFFPVYRGNFSGALRYLFWTFRRYNVNGACYWCVGPRGRFIPKSYGFVHEDDVQTGDGTFYYPIPKDDRPMGHRGGISVPPPPYWHAARLTLIRDGIEDREYLWLMDNLIRKADTKIVHHPGLKTKINEVRMFVRKFVHQEAEPKRVDSMRKKIADIICKLQRVCK